MTDEKQRADTSTQDPAKKIRRSMATRHGSAKWTGDLKTGSGELTVGEAGGVGHINLSATLAS
jgi:hypothetical protein